MEHIREGLQQAFHITDEAVLDRAMEIGTVRVLKKGEYLSNWNAYFEDIGFLLHGLFRYFTLDSDGIEHTDCFSFRYMETITTMAGLGTTLPISIQALESSAVFILPLAFIQELIATSAEAMRAYNDLTSRSMQQHWQMKQVLYQMQGIDKYRWFLKNHGDLLERVPLEHIASYLGIRPQSLSRFHRQIREEEQSQD